MIKQFNFYDIYGYLIPGMLLVGLFWLPVGILTQSWPAQDLSKALFLTVLSYILGHILQTIAASMIPSAVLEKKQRRYYSDIYLDKSNTKRFRAEFKDRLAAQVLEMFGLDLKVTEDVILDREGRSAISTNRQTAFFQARSYLIAKKVAQYAEQNEGLYAMMRGLSCSFCAGALYLAGWGLSVHRDQLCLRWTLVILLVLSVGGALVSSCVALLLSSSGARIAAVCLALFLMLSLLCSGFWIGAEQPGGFWSLAPAHAEWILWASACLALVAATRCISLYRFYSDLFAQTVWRDFSAYLSFQGAPKSS